MLKNILSVCKVIVKRPLDLFLINFWEFLILILYGYNKNVYIHKNNQLQRKEDEISSRKQNKMKRKDSHSKTSIQFRIIQRYSWIELLGLDFNLQFNM